MRTGKNLLSRLLLLNTDMINTQTIAASSFNKSCLALQDSQLLQNRNLIL